ncbi:Choline transport protein [Fusarium oxysporum f. sp. albedinis]|nr:Choline transport protein [Fusarium oxysporum f. sp. albedinis]
MHRVQYEISSRVKAIASASLGPSTLSDNHHQISISRCTHKYGVLAKSRQQHYRESTLGICLILPRPTQLDKFSSGTRR